MQAQGWTDQELLLLLEGIELYGDSWADIAEHVGTKSQVRRTLHLTRQGVEVHRNSWAMCGAGTLV